MTTFTPPFRVGRTQKRAILDANGYDVVVFKNEVLATIFVRALNDYILNIHSSCTMEQKIKIEELFPTMFIKEI